MPIPLPAMSALLLSLLGLSAGITHCPVWKEIAPCTCKNYLSKTLTTVMCDKMGSFDEASTLLRGHFGPGDRVNLKVSFSKLDDLHFRTFKELNMSIENLNLNHDNIRHLEANTFEGLASVNYLSLADNLLGDVPEHLWKNMPGVKTLDLSRTKIKKLTSSSFKGLPTAQCIVLAGNMIAHVDEDTFPRSIKRLHIGRNNLKTLNKTLTNLSELSWLFANSNELTDLEDEFPVDAKSLDMIHFSDNQIEKLPQQLRSLTNLQSVFFKNNMLKSLDGILGKARKMQRLVLEDNQINMLTPEDFAENEKLESLILAYNHISNLNHSLLKLASLNFLNMTHNLMAEFSFQEIAGLDELRSIDLSFNRIKTLIGPAHNLVDTRIKLSELKLDHNEIESLDGAVSGLPVLLRLDLSFNKLSKISPDDLIGLDQLRLLDVSNNLLTTLDETSKTYLPRLEELKASHNFLTILERDFHGLPVLCHADLSDNKIVALSRDLVSKTRCKIGHVTWDTLKINLDGNPILCDAALPEITSYMEINHTRIYGVSICPPLSEQPVTTKPSRFLGYVPETTPTLPAAISTNHQQQPIPAADLEPNNQLKPIYEPVHLALPVLAKNENLQDQPENGTGGIDPVKQEKQLVKLASEIEELRTRLDELTSQNNVRLNHQTPQKSTEQPPNETIDEENRKP